MADIARGQDDALGLARCPGRVDDGDRIGLGQSVASPLTLRSGMRENSRRTNIAEGLPASSARMPSRKAASPQQISAGEQSFIMATSSAGACRA